MAFLYTSLTDMYCLHSKVHTQFQEKNSNTFILLRLLQPTLVTVQWGMYTILRKS